MLGLAYVGTQSLNLFFGGIVDYGDGYDEPCNVSFDVQCGLDYRIKSQG
jgi:hypothetical protein